MILMAVGLVLTKAHLASIALNFHFPRWFDDTVLHGYHGGREKASIILKWIHPILKEYVHFLTDA